MTAVSTQTHHRRNPIVAGIVLITIGAITWAMNATGTDPSSWLGGSGWTLFILIPGMVLFIGGLLAQDEPADGLTIAGSIIMTIAAMLFAMDRTGHYEAWAYAWTLIPGAAGIGVLLRGFQTDDQHKIRAGSRLIAISLVMFALGAVFFETIFQTGTVPFAVDGFWPVLLVIAGVFVIALAFLQEPRRRSRA
ncbi:MAG TPA: hypothetical protein VFN41_14550 [Candidatus Limnocylindrales bacterium]|nr:hypothetical protein [Candidatus Limnocylindrales bacterium]